MCVYIYIYVCIYIYTHFIYVYIYTHTWWINSIVLLYSTGNYNQYPVIKQNRKEYKNECVCITITLLYRGNHDNIVNQWFNFLKRSLFSQETYLKSCQMREFDKELLLIFTCSFHKHRLSITCNRSCPAGMEMDWKWFLPRSTWTT